MARVDSRRMHALRATFFEEGRQLDAAGSDAANCWICRLPIDYDVEPSSTPSSHQLDHFQPVSIHPELQEDPSNFRHAHSLCNGQRGANAPSPGLGEAVPAWW